MGLATLLLVLVVALSGLSAWNLYDTRRTLNETEVLLDRVENAIELRELLHRYPPEVVREAISELRVLLRARVPEPPDPFPEPGR